MGELHDAARQGDVYRLIELLRQRVNINSKDTDGRTPLHLAARQGRDDTVECLVEREADICVTDTHGRTPLYLAAREGRENTVKCLVKHGADICVMDNYGMTPLHLAVKEIEYLVGKEADIINRQDRDGQTALHIAVNKGREQTVKCLVNQKANIRLKDKNGRTPLDVADERDSKIAKFLRESLKEAGEMMTYQHIAVEGGHMDTVKHLVDKGADINTKDDHGMTYLHVAVEGGHMNTVKYLVDKGANINIKDDHGRTPLHIAAREGYDSTVEYLADKGANINSKDYNGWTPLHVAAQEGYEITVKTLISNNADIKIKDSKGMTPLHVAAKSARFQVVEYLVDQGADINTKDSDGRTPLHTAAGEGYRYTVEHLVMKGADITIKDNDEKTVLNLADEKGHKNVSEFLKGADKESARDLGYSSVGKTSSATVDPPKITQHPENQSVFPGMSVDFSIEATGDNLWFQWQKDGIDLSDTDKYCGVNTETLGIVAVEASDEGGYRCFVKNDVGKLFSDEALLSFGNSLTLKNIDQMLTEVLDWHTLGIKLGIPDHSLWKIQINYSTYGVGRQRQEMISNWLKNDTETSWSKLASVLKEMGCNMVAAKIWNQCVLGYRVQRKLHQMMFEAAYHGYSKALEKMLSQFGVQVNSKDQKDGQSVVHIAASGGKLDCLKTFAELENAVDIFTTQDKNGWNVLHHTCASDENSYSVLRWLLEEFPHCDLLKTRDFLNQVQQESEGYSPLLVACKFNKTILVKYLLGFPEVDPSLKTSDGLTCLHLAAKHDAIDIAQEMIERGCPTDSQDKFGNTALHIARKEDSTRIEQLLRERGSDNLTLLKNKEGKTADEMDIEIVIPIEIERRGQEAVKIYRNALQEIPSIEMQVPCCKLLILGDSGTGKTSLLRLLTGESFIPEHISTEGIDTSLVQTRTIGSVDQQTLVTLREDGQFSQFDNLAGAEICERVKKVNCSSILPNITFQSEEEMISELKRLEPNSSDTDAKSPLQSEERQMETENPTQHTQKESSDLRTATKYLPPNLSTQPTQKESSHLSSAKKHLPPSEVFHSRGLSENVVERLNDHNGAEPELRLVTWDFAGQPLYHPVHHCFITYRAMYLVTFKLNEIVESETKESVYSQIAFWLNTIQAHVRHDEASDGSIPPIFLVGTFRDTPSTNGIKVDDEMLNSIGCELRTHFIDAPVENRWVKHIQFFDSDRIFAAVENCPNNRDARKESGAELLRRKMLGTMKGLRFIKEERPLKWLKFEEIIFAMRKDGKKPILVERDTLREEARELKFPDEEFHLLLQFFHDLGTIVNPRELPTLFLSGDEKAILHNVIILDPQWLAKVMTELMNVDYGCKHNPQDIRQLLNHGLAKQSFLKRLWNDYLDRSNQERSFRQLCLFLKAFCLIISASSINISTNQESLYLIPCKLQGKDEPPHSPEYPEEWIQFCFDFKGYLPAEVFHRLSCLLACDSTDPHENTFRYNYCSLWDIQQSNLWLEMHTEKNVLKAYMKPYQPINSQEQITLVEYVHSKLAAICSESGLEGICYIGGPFCRYCADPTVLPLVWYPEMLKGCYQKTTKVAEDPQIADKLIIRCARVQCCKDSDLYELLTSKTKDHPEKSLTYHNIDKILTEVLDWYNLGTKLGLRDYKLGEICRDHTETVRQRQEMISKWLAYDTEASWNKLARALEEIGMRVVAKEILEKYVSGYKRLPFTAAGSGKEKDKETTRQNEETVSEQVQAVVQQQVVQYGASAVQTERKLNDEPGCNSYLGAEVVGEVDLVVTNEAMNFQWKDHGFKLHVPENALPESITEYSVNIRVSLVGQFELPENYELVSAVYWVKTPGKFTKPVVIEVQHCANFNNPNQLCFVCTSCIQKSLPYKYKVVNGGSFVFDKKYGVLSTTNFSGIGVAKKVEPSEHSCQYCAQVYYTVKNLRNYLYYCHFVVTKDLEICLAVVKRKYQQEYDIAPPITFAGDRVALEIPEDGTHTDNGWDIVPVHMAYIKKDRVDNFSSESTWVPECVLLLEWKQKDKAPETLNHKVKLRGTGEESFFRIVYDPGAVSPPQRGPANPPSSPSTSPTSTHDIHGMESVDGTTVLDEDDLRDVKSALASLGGGWKDLGISLGIRFSDLDAIPFSSPSWEIWKAHMDETCGGCKG